MLSSQLTQGEVTNELFPVLGSKLTTGGTEWRKFPAIIFAEEVAAEEGASLPRIFQ